MFDFIRKSNETQSRQYSIRSKNRVECSSIVVHPSKDAVDSVMQGLVREKTYIHSII